MTRYFTHDHEWIALDGAEAVVGITNYAQAALGDITFVDLPLPGAILAPRDAAAVIDSVKAASDVYAPASGAVTAINEALADQPELINTSPEADGWLWRMTLADPTELEGLLDAEAYADYIAEL